MMIRALWSAATGMKAQQSNIDAIANDLTNTSTTAYKKRHVNFTDLFYQTARASGLQSGDTNLPVGIQFGHGVRLAGITPIFTKGSASETGIATDMMIVDQGNEAQSFFGVTLKNGQPAYTRDGSFRVSSEGELLTTDGLKMNPPVTGIPTEAIDLEINDKGQVTYYTEQGGTQTALAPITLYRFQNPAGLSAIGNNMWVKTDASGDPTSGNPTENGFGSITGGYLETSNVDAITEMVNMISAQRSYEFNSKSIQTSDDMLQVVNNLKQ